MPRPGVVLHWLNKRKDTLRPMAAGDFCCGLGRREERPQPITPDRSPSAQRSLEDRSGREWERF